jgi:signal recognition particle GTPase
LLARTARPDIFTRCLFRIVCLFSGREYREYWREYRRTLPEITRDFDRMIAAIDSMTPEERAKPELIGVNREYRIAQGSGARPREVRQLLEMYFASNQALRNWHNERERNRSTPPRT